MISSLSIRLRRDDGIRSDSVAPDELSRTRDAELPRVRPPDRRECWTQQSPGTTGAASSAAEDSRLISASHRGRMNRLLRGALFVVLAGGVTAGCSSSNHTASNAEIGASSSASSAESAALCASMTSLQKSMADLKNVHPAQNGVGALQPAVASVQGNVQQVVADAKNQFAPQVQELKTGFDAVKSAATAARTAPSAQTLGAV